jgi:hypothetical protein
LKLVNEWPMLSAITLYNLAKKAPDNLYFWPYSPSVASCALASSNVTTEETARQSFQSLYI